MKYLLPLPKGTKVAPGGLGDSSTSPAAVALPTESPPALLGRRSRGRPAPRTWPSSSPCSSSASSSRSYALFSSSRWLLSRQTWLQLTPSEMKSGSRCRALMLWRVLRTRCLRMERISARLALGTSAMRHQRMTGPSMGAARSRVSSTKPDVQTTMVAFSEAVRRGLFKGRGQCKEK